MTNDPDKLLDYLLTNHESEYVEFKENNYRAENVGQLVSALANGAVLKKKDEAFLIFGVNDNHEIVGTTFDPDTAEHGNQPYINYIATNLDHAQTLEYTKIIRDGKRVVVVIIPRAKVYPVKFCGVEYIRVSSSRKKLSEHPEIARRLWEEILRTSFEDGHATGLVSAEEVEKLLDFSSYYQLQDLAVPVSQSERLRAMVREGVIVRKYGEYYITNLGALLFARRMNDFDVLLNKNVRLIRYQGTDKLGVQQALEGTMGYAVGIENLLDYTMVMLPSEEYLHGGTRKIRQVFPREAIRELMANMLIHQDLSVVGYSPRVEIYENRVEFSNPGEPIIAVDRFLSSNQSRNPRLAKLMRQMKLCEERGMGMDIVERSCEKKYLPSPSVLSIDNVTRITLFDHKTLRQFTSSERVNLVYWHCELQFIDKSPMTNETLRSRFATGTLSTIVASRWINEALDAKVIKPFDPDSQSRRHAKYIPYWA